MNTTFTWTVTEDDAGDRLDSFLANQLADSHSRTRLQQLLKSGAAVCNDKIITKPAQRLQINDALTLTLPPDLIPQLAPEALDLPVIWEDEHIIVVNKPAGMLTHPTPHQLTGTVVNALLHHCAGQLSGINGVLRPGIVHRLDKDTSGLLMVAKSDVAHRGLSDQLQPFAPNRASRRYRAIVQGQFAAGASGAIITGIGRDPKNRQKMTVTPTGRDAHTDWCHIQALQGPLHLLEASLRTGRTHQIRVHFAWKGWPILGDPLYGTGLINTLNPKLQRQLLQAYQLAFTHPVTGKAMAYTLPDPDPDFLPFLNDLPLN
jgi:23S rRNA pseudouridine1911/1915/1917 synthase